MRSKRLKNGTIALDSPTWAKRKGCVLTSTALGTDFASAKQRCDEVLNLQFDAWLAGSSPETIVSDRPVTAL